MLGVRTDVGTKYPCFFLSFFTGTSFCLPFFFFPITKSILVLFLLPLLLLSHQGRSSSQYGGYWERIWKDLGAELKKISGCLFCFFFIFIYCFVTRFPHRLCLSPSLYAVIPLYINKSHHCFISYILSLLLEMVMP